MSYTERENYIDDLKKFADDCENILNTFISSVTWDVSKEFGDIFKEKTPDSSDMEIYQDLLLPDYPNMLDPRFSVKIGLPDLRNPPKLISEYVTNFTRKERLAFYKYTLENTVPVLVPPELHIPEEIYTQTEVELSPLEKLKRERDAKRRRQVYRSRTSTKNKTPTEVNREVINNFMELLYPTLDKPLKNTSNETDNIEPDQFPKDQSLKKKSLHSSHSSHRSHKRNRYDRHSRH